jgi:3(or 17)beta-hydroxysteroid dehydrogenase
MKQAEENAQARGVSVESIIADAKVRNPMGELTLPEDVGAAVAFLASEDSRHITGTKLIVDGGVVECDTFRMTLKN